MRKHRRRRDLEATVKSENPRIRNLRRSKGWTQSKLAARADVSVRTIQFAESGRGTLKFQTLQQIATALDCDAAELLVEDSCHRDDALQRIPWSVSTMLQRRFSLNYDATPRRQEQVIAVLTRMRQEWKKHLQLTPSNIHDPTFLHADKTFDEDLERYIDRYLAIWSHDPRTIQIATDGQHQFGLSIVLPLSKEAFEAFAQGKLALLDLRAQHLVPQSQYLLLDSVCEFEAEEHVSWYQLTSTLSFTMISQIARFAIDPLRSDFQMVSFAASQLNAVRLKEAGFRPNGRVAPRIDCPINLFTRMPTDRFNDQYVQAANMSHIARLTRESWIAGLNRRRKQAAFVLILKTLKWTQALRPSLGSSSLGSENANAGTELESLRNLLIS